MKDHPSADIRNTPHWGREYITVILSGVIGLVGALAGSFVTGYFTVQSQRILSDQQKTLFARQLTANERQDLKKAVSEYIELISDYSILLSSTTFSESDFDSFAKRAFASSIEITVLVSFDLGQKTTELNGLLVNALKAKLNDSCTDTMINEVMIKLGEWMMIAKAEAKMMEYSASPDNMKSDFLRLILTQLPGKSAQQSVGYGPQAAATQTPSHATSVLSTASGPSPEP